MFFGALKMVNLNVEYMGLELINPVIIGACEMTSDVDTIRKIEKSGAGAVVIKSLFEEQIQYERYWLEEETTRFDDLHAEMADDFPEVYHSGPDKHLMWVRRAVEAVDMPVIASLNAVNEDTWIEYSKKLEETGAQGLELNLYQTPEKLEVSGSDIEMEQIKMVEKVVKSVDIPVSVKLSENYTNPLNFIHKLDGAGVSGFVLFNRFFQPDIDVMSGEEIFRNTYSDPGDYKRALRYAGILRGKISGDICASGGIYSGMDAMKLLMAGANTIQTVSAIYKHGLEHVETMLKQITEIVDGKGEKDLDDLIGTMSKENMDDPFAYTRYHYIRMLNKPKPLDRKDINMPL
jgi:dihydroorotate dehydrogenase (fumarate)